jgi:hypothetical protein
MGFIRYCRYVQVQAAGAWRKIHGKTLKQCRCEEDDKTLILLFLDDLWGVQVSFGTGIARRVPLREMVADLLPVFTKAFMSSRREMCLWDELEKPDLSMDADRRESRTCQLSYYPLNFVGQRFARSSMSFSIQA